jgi:hypothetical protein
VSKGWSNRYEMANGTTTVAEITMGMGKNARIWKRL